MTSYKFEYIWLDGYKPIANLRSKTKIIAFDNFDGDIAQLPDWNFDGSSTLQAEGKYSEVILKPVRLYEDPGRKNAYIVVSECFNPEGVAIASNTRALIGEQDDPDFWWGFEQEYVLLNDAGRPIGFPTGGYPEPQGPYYCAVGYDRVAGRDIIEEHMDMCIAAGLGISGINAEVMLGQWEYQIFGKGVKAADDLLVSRYFLFRITEQYQVTAELHPKPIKGDWNGSGMHANFSWGYFRETGGKEYMESILKNFEKYKDEHLAEYGAYNEERLTGAHETASYKEFSYGVADRGASIRIPVFTAQDGYKGYLEDRRPASNADPYRIVSRIMATVKEAHNNWNK